MNMKVREKCVHILNKVDVASLQRCAGSHKTMTTASLTTNPKNNDNEDFKCFSCHMSFDTKHNMMKHKKLKHIEEVMECSKFKEGNCGFSDKFCWNRHITKHKDPLMHDTNEVENEINQDFHSNPVNLAPPEKRF